MDAKAGSPITYDDGFIASQLDERLERARYQLRITEDLRAVVVRPTSPGAPSAVVVAGGHEAASTRQPA